MKLGFMGLPMSGKTTIFNTLTDQHKLTSSASPGKLDVQVAVVEVPDPQLDSLHTLFQRGKKVYAKVTYADIGGLKKGISAGGLSGPFRNELSQMDAFIHVIRAFEDPAVPHTEETIDPQRDHDLLETEFILADLITVENRVARLTDEMSKGKNRAENARELALFEVLQKTLEGEQPLRAIDLPDADRHAVRGYGFLSLKPKLILVNYGDEITPPPDKVVQAHSGVPVMAIQGKIEAEIDQLDPEEAALFRKEYNISEPVKDRIIRESYSLLDVRTFYTVGDDEVRAWTTKVGATALEAAGTIHTDLQRGFIRAEIISCKDLLELEGWAEARQAGKLRLEGRNYVLQDCDVVTIRFNI